MLLFFQGVYQLREFKPGESPVEIPGPDWWAKRAFSGGANACLDDAVMDSRDFDCASFGHCAA